MLFRLCFASLLGIAFYILSRFLSFWRCLSLLPLVRRAGFAFFLHFSYLTRHWMLHCQLPNFLAERVYAVFSLCLVVCATTEVVR